ncbi:hypothetical protein [Nonomuraea sp. SBT364]|uniref:hypothetical protein n=1 Tax=Nonomuraea sp. SBT364 TaxID=1580530 RepID=UPI00066AAE05|nr:hypothetical protein [Nonomuraea sp. SBT364]
MWADVAAHVALRGLTPGAPVEIGLTRHLDDGTLADVAWPIDRRARVTIRHVSPGPVVLEPASAFKAILHRYP